MIYKYINRNPEFIPKGNVFYSSYSTNEYNVYCKWKGAMLMFHYLLKSKQNEINIFF